MAQWLERRPRLEAEPSEARPPGRAGSRPPSTPPAQSRWPAPLKSPRRRRTILMARTYRPLDWLAAVTLPAAKTAALPRLAPTTKASTAPSLACAAMPAAGPVPAAATPSCSPAPASLLMPTTAAPADSVPAAAAPADFVPAATDEARRPPEGFDRCERQDRRGDHDSEGWRRKDYRWRCDCRDDDRRRQDHDRRRHRRTYQRTSRWRWRDRGRWSGRHHRRCGHTIGAGAIAGSPRTIGGGAA